jgi:hypothetical protein
MIDPGSPKLIVPAAIFAGLSYLNLTPVERAAWFVLSYFLIVKSGLLKVSLTRADLVVPAVLIATLPSFKMPWARTLVFIIVFAFLRSTFPGYY